MTCAPAYGLGTSKKKKKKKKKNPTQIMTCAPAYGLGTSKKPYADYDLRPRPMAWAQVITWNSKKSSSKVEFYSYNLVLKMWVDV